MGPCNEKISLPQVLRQFRRSNEVTFFQYKRPQWQQSPEAVPRLKQNQIITMDNNITVMVAENTLDFQAFAANQTG